MTSSVAGIELRGEKLRALRRQRGLAQDALARRVGIDPKTLGDLERDRRSAQPSTWSALATALCVDPQELLRPGLGLLVLPFTMDGEDLPPYLAEGVRDALITRMGRAGLFPVVERRAVLEPQADASAAARRFDVRYAVTGHVRRRRRMTRVNVALVDTTESCELWAHDYEVDPASLLQADASSQSPVLERSERTREAFPEDACVNRIAPDVLRRIVQSEASRIGERPPKVATATEHALIGLFHYDQGTKVATDAAIRAFVSSLEQDPALEIAAFYLGRAHYRKIMYQWSSDADAAISALDAAAETCLRFDRHSPRAHLLVALRSLLDRSPSAALDAFNQAVHLNPSFAHAYSLAGQTYALVERPDLAMSYLRAAARLGADRETGDGLHMGVGLAHFVAEDYERAIASARESLRANPRFFLSHICIAASAGMIGDHACASGALATLRKGGFSMSRFQRLAGCATPQVWERFREGMARAGWV